MSESDYAIRVEGLGKRYRIGLEQAGGAYKYKSLRDSLAGLSRRPLAAAKSALVREPMNEINSFWALDDVNFDVKRGEVVGIIGRNGAGKSTLLKILSRITKPTTGRIELRGRVGSLLEVGTGFHPELTGRENIYLNGAVLGMTRAEVRQKFDEIVTFSEVEKFLNTAVKHYSSGMYMRLAFAVAAHLEPEILVVDEVLAVGDSAFQQKCLGRMKEVAVEGRTVLFVSHNLAAVTGLCNSGLYLDQGRSLIRGKIDEVVQRYRDGIRSMHVHGSKRHFTDRSGSELNVEEAGVDEDTFSMRLTGTLGRAVNRFGIGLHIIGPDGYRLSRLWPAYCLPEFGTYGGNFIAEVRIWDVSKYLAAGGYRVDVSLHDTHTALLLHAEEAATLDVPEVDVMRTGYPFRYESSGPVPLRGQIELVRPT